MIETKIVDGAVIVVERKKHVALWGRKDFAPYNDDFKRARSRMLDKLDRCFCCDWPFQLNKEHVNLVSFTGVGNKCVCADCFSKLVFRQQLQG